MEVHLYFPVNAMTRVCKKLSLPKKAAVEAIAMFEMSYGGGTATAHDVFLCHAGDPVHSQDGQIP